MTLQCELRRAVPAIATMYNGTLFRSRLEARWAAMFDALKWPWEYEPIDLDYYIPDFILLFEASHVAVEVKPETEIANLRKHAMAAVQAGWRKEVLALGATLFEGDKVGICAEPIGGGEYITGPARLFYCIDCGTESFLNDDHGWHCRSCGCYAGNAHVGDADPAEISNLWKQSGNRVQWRPGA